MSSLSAGGWENGCLSQCAAEDADAFLKDSMAVTQVNYILQPGALIRMKPHLVLKVVFAFLTKLHSTATFLESVVHLSRVGLLLHLNIQCEYGHQESFLCTSEW